MDVDGGLEVLNKFQSSPAVKNVNIYFVYWIDLIFFDAQLTV